MSALTTSADARSSRRGRREGKMDVHDLSEELPQNWQAILDVARRTHDAFQELERKRAELKQLGSE